MDNPQTAFKNQISVSGRIGWQTEAWDMLDAVGELRYYVGWRANSCSRVRLVASELDEDGLPTGKCDNPRVNDIVKAIGGGNQLGAGQLIRRTVECLTVPGEVWIAILIADDGTEKWFAFSRDEIRKKGQKFTVEMPDGSEHDFRVGTDVIFRVWNPHPRRAREADSPVRASLDALNEIVRTTKTIANAGKSRLIGNGIVFVPQEMSLPMANSPISADKPGDPVAGVSGLPAVQELQELLFNVAKVAYEDDESFAAMIPIFASVPGELISKVSHLQFGNEITDTNIKLRNDAIARLAMGLDVSPERLLGLGSSTNHWSAWQIGDTDVQLHIAPVMETVCQAITDQVFRQVLIREGIDTSRYVVWYDASQLTVDPDKTDTATDAFDRGVITATAYREYLGLDADSGYDFDSLDGWRKWAQDQVSNEPKLLPELLPLLDAQVQSLEFPQPQIGPGKGNGDRVDAQDPQSDTTNEGDNPQTEDKDPGYDQGKRGRKRDVGKSVDHQSAFVRVFVDRALELAGKRRRNRSNQDRLRGLRPHHFHRVMGPVDDADIPDLIKGWDEALEDDVLAMMGVDRGDLADQVRREIRRQLTAQVVDV